MTTRSKAATLVVGRLMSFPRYVPIKRVPSRIFHSIDVGDVFFCVKGVKKDAISNVSDGCRG
jgi:hypothetical protein